MVIQMQQSLLDLLLDQKLSLTGSLQTNKPAQFLVLLLICLQIGTDPSIQLQRNLLSTHESFRIIKSVKQKSQLLLIFYKLSPQLQPFFFLVSIRADAQADGWNSAVGLCIQTADDLTEFMIQLTAQ